MLAFFYGIQQIPANPDEAETIPGMSSSSQHSPPIPPPSTITSSGPEVELSEPVSEPCPEAGLAATVPNETLGHSDVEVYSNPSTYYNGRRWAEKFGHSDMSSDTSREHR